jgi:transglutaminase-like putative cysteine protease
MTAIAPDAFRETEDRAWQRLRVFPPEGGLAVGLMVVLCLALAWSVDDARLVLNRDEYTDFLVWPAVGGALAGVIGAFVGWGRWTTHLIGAVFAAILTPLLVGMVLLLPDGGNPSALFQATTDAVVGAWSDLALAGRLSTFQYGHHLLLLGLIVWASAQFAAYAAFGHRRPLNAVVVIGLLLIANMSLTLRDQMLFLVIFSIASLFLLVRFHTFDEQTDWLRRRIGDPAAIGGLYLRGGTLFIVVAVIGSLLLTNVAASAPLSGAWTDVGARLIDWSRSVSRFLPESGSGRSIGPAFGDNARIGGSWTTNDDPALTIGIAPTERDVPYLAAVVYDTFEMTGWRRSPSTVVARDASTELLAGTGDRVDPAGRREITITVTPATPRENVFTPEMPVAVDQPVSVRLAGEGGFFAGLERSSSTSMYTVRALVPASEQNGGPTENRLRVAGTDYPAAILAQYGKDTVPDGVIGPRARALLDEIVAAADANPYDLAKTTRDVLLDSTRFRYDTDVSDEDCRGLSTVECFATIESGFCEYYATTMAILLREMGVPTRFVEGFLPGERDLAERTSLVRNSDAHAWVQVYFPGYGWIDFDPTGGSVGQLAPLPSGRPEASPTAPSSIAPGGPIAPPSLPVDREEPGGTGGTVTPRNESAGPLIAVAILLAVIVAALAAVAWQRGPRGPVSAESTYGSVARLASRFGFGPRPYQTVYEYASTLGEALPSVRPELETVARAKVEVAYGGRTLDDARLSGLRAAHRRLRVGLLRLALPRGRRRRG